MELLDFHFASATAFTYAVVKWLLLALLLTSSHIWNHARFAVPLVLGLGLIGVGMLVKIEHWPFAEAPVLVGAATAVSSYALWFRRKGEWALLDYLKLAWVVSANATAAAAVVFHPVVRVLAGGTETLFWAMALLLVYQRWIRRPDTVE